MKKYAIIVYWSDEDAVWIAEAPDLELCAAHGSTPERALAELRVAMDLWLEVAREAGQPIPDANYQPHTEAAEQASAVGALGPR
jgi:predicted RNase H-like HicB family nuclease